MIPSFIEKRIRYKKYNLMGYESHSKGEPILLINGGPGLPSMYIRETHKFLATLGFKLYSWDQLGCGRSDNPRNPALWTIERYVEETEHIRENLGLEKFHLLGHSWGGVLAMVYALQYQKRLKSLLLTNTTANAFLLQKGFERHRAALGPKLANMMKQREKEGTTDHPEYVATKKILHSRHTCRVKILADLDHEADINHEIRTTLLGPHPFDCSGSLGLVNRSADLKHIRVPTLILHGEHDQMIPECAQEIHASIPGSRLKIFNNAAHIPVIEAPIRYFREVIPFLKKHS